MNEELLKTLEGRMGLNQVRAAESVVARTGTSERTLVSPKGEILGLLIAAWAAGKGNSYGGVWSEIGSWDRHTVNQQKNDPWFSKQDIRSPESG